MPASNSSSDAVDSTAPHPIRVYDYFIGGDNCLPADRAAGAWIQATAPDLLTTMQESKAFARRAIRSVTKLGVKQFIDIGSGFPNSPNTHEIAQSIDATAKVVYTDVDPTVARHMESFLKGSHGTVFVQADIRDPETIFAHRSVADFIDFKQPVACMLAAVFHFIPDVMNPDGIASSIRAALPSSSYFIVSHLASDIPWDAKNNKETIRRATADLYPRTRSQVRSLFGDFEFITPGLVRATEWRPGHELSSSSPGLAIYGGVACKN